MEKIIYIPDEYIPDFSLSKEEEKKRWEEWSKKSDEAWEKIDEIMKDEICKIERSSHSK